MPFDDGEQYNSFDNSGLGNEAARSFEPLHNNLINEFRRKGKFFPPLDPVSDASIS